MKRVLATMHARPATDTFTSHLLHVAFSIPKKSHCRRGTEEEQEGKRNVCSAWTFFFIIFDTIIFLLMNTIMKKKINMSARGPTNKYRNVSFLPPIAHTNWRTSLDRGKTQKKNSRTFIWNLRWRLWIAEGRADARRKIGSCDRGDTGACRLAAGLRDESEREFGFQEKLKLMEIFFCVCAMING